MRGGGELGRGGLQKGRGFQAIPPCPAEPERVSVPDSSGISEDERRALVNRGAPGDTLHSSGAQVCSSWKQSLPDQCKRLRTSSGCQSTLTLPGPGTTEPRSINLPGRDSRGLCGSQRHHKSGACRSPPGLVTVADPGSLKTPHVRDRLLKKEHPLSVGSTTVRERESASWGLPG